MTKLRFNVGVATLVTQLDELSTLTKAATEADVVETLLGLNPLTIFAPDNEAFSKVPVGAVGSLLDNKAQLTSVLTYHVVSGRYFAADLAKLKALKTIQGGMLKVHERHGPRHGIKINDAEIKEANLECTNGIVHIIDTVLMPK